MLEPLDDLEWQNIADAFGPAVQVPRLIRDLASTDPEVRTSALENLTNHIWHQTSLYEATVRAVPFLVDLLLRDDVQDKHLILSLLWGIAGAGAPSIHPPFSDLAKYPPPRDALARRIYMAVREGIPAYLRFLDAQDLRLRATASGVLSLFAEDALLIAPRLREVIEAEHDPTSRSEMVETFGFLITTGREHLDSELASYRAFLEDLLSPGRDAAVRFAAACALVPLLGAATTRDTTDILLDAISRPFEYSRFFTPHAVPGEAAKALSFLGPERGIPALIEGVRRSEGYPSVHDIIERLLDMAFSGKQARNFTRTYRTGKDDVREIRYSPRGNFRRDEEGLSIFIPQVAPVVRVERLSGEEREAVNAIVQADSAWTYRTNLYELYGLPNNRPELRALAGLNS